MQNEVTDDSVLIALSKKLKARDVKHCRIQNSKELQNDYVFKEQLGVGCFSTVIKVIDKNTQKKWAVKMIDKKLVGPFKIKFLEREILILKSVSHPNIVYLEKTYESHENIYLVLEMCNGTLAELFKVKQLFDENETRRVIKDLSSAFAYLHRNDIVHRDLKLENILLVNDPDKNKDDIFIKVSDFGLSTIKVGAGIENMLHDVCGTFVYMEAAPEMFSRHYSQQCDVWAMGVIMYLLLSGHFPFYSNDQKELMNKIRLQEPSFTEFTTCKEIIHLMTKMLTKNPALRISATEIEKHPWVQKQNMSYQSSNVLDMMKLWKSEMMMDTGDECDWISLDPPTPVPNSRPTMNVSPSNGKPVFEENKSKGILRTNK